MLHKIILAEQYAVSEETNVRSGLENRNWINSNNLEDEL